MRLVLMCAALALAACDPALAQSGAGVITGEVRYIGSAPKPKPINRAAEPACDKGKAFDQSLSVKGGKLANVHVSIKSGTVGKHKPPAKPVIVYQNQCVYEPRVQGIQEGQKLLIANGDPVMHNVHAKRDGGTWTNQSQKPGGKRLELDVGKAGEVLRLGCDVHRWMRAYLPITDHPFFDVTGADGTFRIEGVPAGKTVTIEAWHETLGKKTVEAKAGDAVVIKFLGR